MLIVEVNDLTIINNKEVDGFLIGTKFISGEVYKKFEKEEVLEFTNKAHQLGKRVVLDATSIFHEQDLFKVKEIIEYLNDVDLIMYNDLALMKLIPLKKRFYYSTTYITNKYDFEIVKDENSKVLVSPELTLNELKLFSEKEGAILIGFGTWEIFHSKRNLLSNYMEYRSNEYVEGTYHIIEEFRSELYPIIEENGTKIYLNGYYFLGKELEYLSKDLILKVFDLNMDIVEKVIGLYKKAIVINEFIELENEIKKLPINTNKGLLYEQSILTKGVSERG